MNIPLQQKLYCSLLTWMIAIDLYQQLSHIWGKAGMHARKWLSNSTKVLEQVPEGDRATEVDINTGQLPTIKTLGLFWIATEDMFAFKVNTWNETVPITKRTFMGKIATLFDHGISCTICDQR